MSTKLKRFVHQKPTKKVKRQFTEQEKILVNHLSNKGLVKRI